MREVVKRDQNSINEINDRVNRSMKTPNPRKVKVSKNRSKTSFCSATKNRVRKCQKSVKFSKTWPNTSKVGFCGEQSKIGHFLQLQTEIREIRPAPNCAEVRRKSPPAQKCAQKCARAQKCAQECRNVRRNARRARNRGFSGAEKVHSGNPFFDPFFRFPTFSEKCLFFAPRFGRHTERHRKSRKKHEIPEFCPEEEKKSFTGLCDPNVPPDFSRAKMHNRT